MNPCTLTTAQLKQPRYLKGHRHPIGGLLHQPLLHLSVQFAAMITLAALWPLLESPFPMLLWWIGLTIAQLVVFGASLRRFTQRRNTAESGPSPVGRYFSPAGALIGGGTWGALALIGPFHANPQAQTILCVVLCSITLAAATLVRRRSTYLTFTVAVLLPLFIELVVTPPTGVPSASYWLLAFIVFAVMIHGLQSNLAPARPGGDLAATPREPQLSMLDNARAAIVISRGNRVEACNQRFAGLMKCNEADVAGNRLAEGFESRADWRRHARAAARTLRHGGTYHGSTRLRRRDGSVFWAEITGQTIDPESTPPKLVWVAFDVSERMMESSRDELLATQLRNLLAKSADWYWQTDALHHLSDVAHDGNPFSTILKTHLGQKWWHLSRQNGPLPALREDLLEAFESRRGFRNLLVEIPNGSGATLWLRLCGTPRHDEYGAFLGHHGTAVDVTEQIRNNERNHHLAYHDALTGLPNRRLLTDRLTQAMARAQRNQERVGLIFVDLDDFRRINDLGGHAAGDEVLLEIADRLRTCVRACDTVARLDCDEFVILLGELDEAADASLVAAKILSHLQEPFSARRARHPISTSMGVATFPEDAATAEFLLQIADARMFRAKRRGGQRIESSDGAPRSAIANPERLPLRLS